MKIKFILVSSLLFIVLACNLNDNKFHTIESTGLDETNLALKTMLFCNRDTGFIVGSSDSVVENPDFPIKDSNQFAFAVQTALLYQTTNGGEKWTKHDFGKGSIFNIFKTNDKIFVTKIEHDSSTDLIYSSQDYGRHWTEETTFPKGIGQLFSIKNGYLAIATDSRLLKTNIVVSEDFGKSWQSINSSLLAFNAVIKGSDLFFLSTVDTNQYKKNRLIKLEVKNGKYQSIELPQDFDCYFLTDYSGKMTLTGLKDKHISVYSVLENGEIKYEYSYTKSDKFFPVSFFSSQSEDWIVAGRREKADISFRILKTGNGGKNWDVVEFERDNYIDPFYFYDDEGKVRAWFYAGSGNFQVLR